MSNNLRDLTNELMETLRKTKEGKINTETANAVGKLGDVIIKAGRLELDFLDKSGALSEHQNEPKSLFLETPETKAAIDSSVQSAKQLTEGRSENTEEDGK